MKNNYKLKNWPVGRGWHLDHFWKKIISLCILLGSINYSYSQTVIQIGTGNGIPSVGGNPTTSADACSPYGGAVSSGANGRKIQMIYTKAMIETAMINACLTPGSAYISTVGYNITGIVTAGLSNANYTVKMANVPQADLASGYYTGATTTVYGPTATNFPSTGWFSLNIPTPFLWDGVSSLCVEICYTFSMPFIVTTYGGCEYTAVGGNNHMGFAGGASASCATAFPGTGSQTNRLCNVRLTATHFAACAGIPASLPVCTATPNICNTTNTTISASINATGYTFQWQESSSIGGPYINVTGGSGGTTKTFTSPNGASLPSYPTYYRCNVRCTASAQTTASQISTVNLNSFSNCYCTTNFSTVAATSVRGLTNVNLVGNTITINNTTAANTASPSPYNVYATPVADLTKGLGYSLKTTVGTATNSLHYVAAWIDYNQDGYFGGYTSGGVFNGVGDYSVGGLINERIITVGPTANVQSTTAFTVPAGAGSGATAMRIRYRYGATMAGIGACQVITGAATTGGAGEVEDYQVNLITPCSAPSTAASASLASNLQATTADLSWTSGNGTGGRIILLKQGSAVNSAPVSGTTYTANTTFGSGDLLGTGNYVVYKGTGASTSIAGLLPSTTYHYSIFEYNTASTCFMLTGHTGSFTTASCSPTVQPSGATICTEYTSLNLTFGRGNGDRTLVVARAGSAVNADPVYNTNYASSSTFGSGDQIGTGNYVIYNGNTSGAATINLSGLSQGTTYHFKFYEYFESPNCYNLTSVPTLSASTRNAGVYSSSNTTQISTSTQQGTINQQVVSLAIVMAGGVDEAAGVNSITFTTTGTTDVSNLRNARIFYTGTSSTFSEATQFGNTVVNPSGTHVVNGNFKLLSGTNYFWVAYDLTGIATLGNVIDATITSFNLIDNGGTSNRIPSTTAPAGSRTISSAAYCSASSRPGCSSYGYNPVPTFAGYTYNYTCAGNYQDLTGSLPGATVNPGGTYNFSSDVDDWINLDAISAAWVDWNQNNVFDHPSERIAVVDPYTTVSVVVPAGAIPGVTRMRVYMHTEGGRTTNPCQTGNGALSTSIGHIIDVRVNVTGTPPVGGEQNVCPTSIPVVSTPVTYAKNDVAGQLTATGTSLLWYLASTGGVGNATAPTPTTTAAGTTAYYVSQNTGCEGPRTQIAVTVTTTCGPIAYAVSGGNNCNSTTVGLVNSESGVSYQLYLDGNPINSPVAGTGTAISFGVQTTTGLYTVVGTDAQPVSTNMLGNSRLWVSPTATITGTLLGCLPAGVVLSATSSIAGSGTITGRQWKENTVDIPLANNPTYNATVSNNYSIVITNSNGCTATSSQSAVVVNTPPTANGSGTLVTCESAAITISGASSSNGTVTWAIQTGNGGISNIGSLTPTYTPVAADAGTTVVLTLTVSNPPCADAVYNQQIIIRPRPVLSPASVNICTGNVTQQIDVVSPQPNTDYKWLPVNDLYLDAALTIPYTVGTPATSVWTAPFGSTSYNVTATNTTDNCITGATNVAVTVCSALTNSICDADLAPLVNVTTTPTFTLYSLTGATVSGGASCAPIARDVWYKVQIPANGELNVITALHNNPIAALNIQSSVVTIFAGANCSSVASVNCNSNGAAGNMSFAHASGLTPGTFAYIRLGSTVAGNTVAAQFIRMAVTSGLVWTAAADDNFNNPANWHGGDATALTKTDATISAIIPSTLTKPKLYANSVSRGMNFATVPPYFVSPGINLNGFTLSVKTDWVVGPALNSTLTLDCNGTVELSGNGVVAQVVSGKTTFGNLTTNNTVAGINLINLTGVSCVLTTVAGNLASNGFLTLKSTATTTALVNPIGGAITGNVSVERKITSISGYHYLSSPVSGAFVNNSVSGWRDDFTILNTNDNVAFIPGNTYTQLPSVWEYNETDLNPNPGFGWFSTTASDDPITPLKGFACVVPSAIVVDVSGPLNNGNVAGGYTITRTAGTGIGEGSNAIGNPYASPISWNAFRALPTNSTLLSASGYQAFISSGGYGGSYGSWDGTVGSPSSVTDKISSSQGIMVSALTTGSINAANSVRLTSAIDVNATFFNGYNSVPDLIRFEIQGNGHANETAIYFDPSGADTYNINRDARLLYAYTAGVPNIYSNIENTPLNINVMGKLDMDKVVPLGVKIQTAGTYNIVATDMTSFAPSVVAYLEDTQAGTMTNLRTNPSYSVTLPVGEINNRFFIHFHPAVELNAVNESCAGNDGKLVINYPTSNTVNVVIKDANGNVVNTQNNLSGVVTINNLLAGNYVAEMTFGIAPNTYTTSDYFTVAGGNAVYANLSSSATTVDMASNTTVNFTATAQGATSFNWNFGDGTVITNGPANVSHTFTQVGTYNVTFEASNGICTTVASTTVEATNATGLTAVSNSNLQVVGLGSKVTVRFGNKMEGTGNIEVINMLGEVVAHLDNVSMKGTREIEMSTVAAGQYMVKITNNSKLYTEKVYLSRQ